MSQIVTTNLGRFRRVNLNSSQPPHDAWLFECPCGQWAYLDEDQWAGRVSVDHASEGCLKGYHETHNFGAELIAVMQSRILAGESSLDVESSESTPPQGAK